MQNYYKTIGALVVASAFAAGNASAEVEAELTAGYSTGYVFRGVLLGTDLVETGLNVSTEYNGFGISGGLWHGTFENDTDTYSELDIYAQVSKEFSFATLAAGYITYQNEDNFDRNYAELYFSAARQFYGVDFSLTAFYEIEVGKELYLEGKANKSFELSSCLSLNTGLTVGYLYEVNEVTHVAGKVALDYAYSETATISPFVAYSVAISENPATVYDDSNNELSYGVMLSVSF